MSLEIGEITSFCVSFTNVGVASVWGIGFPHVGIVHCVATDCTDQKSHRLTSKPGNKRERLEGSFSKPADLPKLCSKSENLFLV